MKVKPAAELWRIIDASEFPLKPMTSLQVRALTLACVSLAANAQPVPVTLPTVQVESSRTSQLGVGETANTGVVTQEQLEARTVYRPGELLETTPGLVVSQHSSEGKANSTSGSPASGSVGIAFAERSWRTRRRRATGTCFTRSSCFMTTARSWWAMPIARSMAGRPGATASQGPGSKAKAPASPR